jgi:hypothetical protein
LVLGASALCIARTKQHQTKSFRANPKQSEPECFSVSASFHWVGRRHSVRAVVVRYQLCDLEFGIFLVFGFWNLGFIWSSSPRLFQPPPQTISNQISQNQGRQESPIDPFLVRLASCPRIPERRIYPAAGRATRGAAR